MTYIDGFKSWKDVQTEFSGGDVICTVKPEDIKEPDEVLCAMYDLSEFYEGSATVIYRNGRKYYVVSGSHCSCFGLEGQWDPVEYDNKELLIAALEKQGYRNKAEETALSILRGQR